MRKLGFESYRACQIKQRVIQMTPEAIALLQVGDIVYDKSSPPRLFFVV